MRNRENFYPRKFLPIKYWFYCIWIIICCILSCWTMFKPWFTPSYDQNKLWSEASVFLNISHGYLLKYFQMQVNIIFVHIFHKSSLMLYMAREVKTITSRLFELWGKEVLIKLYRFRMSHVRSNIHAQNRPKITWEI